jgi:hypothetical protein
MVAAAREMFPEIGLVYNEVSTDDRLPRSRETLSPAERTTAAPVVLWTYAKDGASERLDGGLGDEARPTVQPPAPDLAAAILARVARHYSRGEFEQAAAELATTLGRARLVELSSALVHPPAVPETTPWDSRFRVQVLIALTLGQWCERACDDDAAWCTLSGLLDGPVDWITTAALLALIDLALRAPDHFEAPVFHVISARLRAPVSPVWYQCYVEPARWLLLCLPGLSDAIAAELVERIIQSP